MLLSSHLCDVSADPKIDVLWSTGFVHDLCRIRSMLDFKTASTVAILHFKLAYCNSPFLNLE